jgi:hypothetical protein
MIFPDSEPDSALSLKWIDINSDLDPACFLNLPKVTIHPSKLNACHNYLNFYIIKCVAVFSQNTVFISVPDPNMYDARSGSTPSHRLSTRGGHAQLFFASAIAIPQLEGSSSAIATPQLFKDMLLRNRNSAIPQSQFFLKSATSSPQLRSFNSTFFGIAMDVESGRFIEKKIRHKNLVLLSL